MRTAILSERNRDMALLLAWAGLETSWRNKLQGEAIHKLPLIKDLVVPGAKSYQPSPPLALENRPLIYRHNLCYYALPLPLYSIIWRAN